MAPLGRLLVFYVRENGEGVTDSLQFSVNSSFENQVQDRKGCWLIALIFGIITGFDGISLPRLPWRSRPTRPSLVML